MRFLKRHRWDVCVCVCVWSLSVLKGFWAVIVRRFHTGGGNECWLCEGPHYLQDRRTPSGPALGLHNKTFVLSYILFIVHECIANHQLWQIRFSFIKRLNFSEKNRMIYYSSLRDWTQYHCLNKSSSCILMTVCILRESFWSICIYSEYELKICISSAELCSTYEWLCKYKVDLRT